MKHNRHHTMYLYLPYICVYWHCAVYRMHVKNNYGKRHLKRTSQTFLLNWRKFMGIKFQTLWHIIMCILEANRTQRCTLMCLVFIWFRWFGLKHAYIRSHHASTIQIVFTFNIISVFWAATSIPYHLLFRFLSLSGLFQSHRIFNLILVHCHHINIILYVITL